LRREFQGRDSVSRTVRHKDIIVGVVLVLIAEHWQIRSEIDRLDGKGSKTMLRERE